MKTLENTRVKSRVLAPILLVDDDTDDCYLSTHLIQRTSTKHPLLTFQEGDEVIDYLNREWSNYPLAPHDLPRLLFIDLKANGMGGFGFLEWKALHPQFDFLEVVVLSGSDELIDIDRARRLGAVHFFAKHPGITTFSRMVCRAYGETALFGMALDLTTQDLFFEKAARGTGAPFPD